MFQDLIKFFCSSKQLKTCDRLIFFFSTCIHGKSSTSWLGISNYRETNYMFKYYKLIKLYIYTHVEHINRLIPHHTVASLVQKYVNK